jgi:hypothetical protein
MQSIRLVASSIKLDTWYYLISAIVIGLFTIFMDPEDDFIAVILVLWVISWFPVSEIAKLAEQNFV